MSETSPNSLNTPSQGAGEETPRPEALSQVPQSEDLDRLSRGGVTSDAASLFAFDVDPLEAIKNDRHAVIKRRKWVWVVWLVIATGLLVVTAVTVIRSLQPLSPINKANFNLIKE